MEGQNEIKRVVSIDLGSTNSQLGVREFYKESGQPVDYKKTFEYLISDNASADIPTVLLKWKGTDKAPDNFDENCGSKAYSYIKSFHKDNIEVITEFKKDLFIPEGSNNDIKKQEEAKENTEKFLRYLKGMMNDSRANYNDNIEENVIITVPVRFSDIDRRAMKKIAQSAGWKNITIRDEANSALDYAVCQPESPVLKALENSTATEENALNVLLIDIGGSTTDIVYTSVYPDGKGSYIYRPKTSWPDIEETETLGQIEVDKAVCELLLREKYLLDDSVKEEIEFYGYKKFREFKEIWSDNAKKNKIIESLNGLHEFESNSFKRTFSEVFYEEEPEEKKLDKQKFELLIKNYIEKMQDAIRYVLKREKLKEDDIDIVVLSGGGSKLYGIKEMLLGSLSNINNPLNFSKLKKDESRIITHKNNPSAVCCMGNLIEHKNIKCIPHINGIYSMELEFFTASAKEVGNDWKGSDYLDSSAKKKVALPSSSRIQFNKSIELNTDKQALPINKTFTENCNLSIKTGEKPNCRITIFKKSSKDGKKYIQCSWLSLTTRDLDRTTKDKWREFKGNIITETLEFKVDIKYLQNQDKNAKATAYMICNGFCSNGGNNGEKEL